MAKIKKTVIITGYTCNNMCQFCIDEDKRGLKDKSTAQIKQEMIGAKDRGTTYLEFIGGECLIRSDILQLLKFAKKLGFETITMATNGRMLGYKEFAEKVVDAGLTDIVFSIHGHTAELHDDLTRSHGSFDELLKGYKYMKKMLGDDRIGTNTTIVKQNIRYLEDIGKFLYDLGSRNAEFIFVDPNYGAAYNNFDLYVPKISQAAAYIKKCLSIGEKGGAHHWHVRYVPLCYFTDYLDQISELQEVATFESEHLAPDFENYDVENSRQSVGRMKTDKCNGCKLFDKCEGIWREYVKRRGDSELIPIIK